MAKIIAEENRTPVSRVILDEQLNQRILDRDTYAFPVWDGKVRLSLAGYQEKLQVLVEGDELSLADGALSSPATVRAYMVRWAILQLLIGNSDAHGKNPSHFA